MWRRLIARFTKTQIGNPRIIYMSGHWYCGPGLERSGQYMIVKGDPLKVACADSPSKAYIQWSVLKQK